jgi:hypothetical protein
VGTASIIAQQNGNDTCNAAAEKVKQLTVLKADQTIAWELPLTAAYGSGAIALNAVAPAGVVTYESSDPAVVMVSGATLTIMGVGTATITAQQNGNANYNAAAEVVKEITILKADQTITWDQPALTARKGDAPITLYATAIAGAVTYTSSDPSVATVSGNTLTIVNAGAAIITASQAGNANYNAAESVTKTLTVSPALAVESSTVALLQVYPNPVVSELIIDNGQLSVGNEVKIYNVNGGLVGVYDVTDAASTTINIAHLPAGTYIVKLGNKTAKVVKQ